MKKKKQALPAQVAVAKNTSLTDYPEIMAEPKSNNKKRTGSKALLIATLGVVSLSVLGGGYYYNLGKSKESSERLNVNLKNQNTNQVMTTEQPQKKANFTSEDLAKQKNLKPRLERPDGGYALVAVIEGEEANARLTKALQVVGNQRQLLANLHQELGALPKGAQQQRELIAGRVNQLETRLGQNLVFLRQNYGYTLQAKYLLVPEEASLVGASADGKRSVVHQFKKFEHYQSFQTKRDGYLRQLAETVSEISEDDKADKEAPATAEESQEFLVKAKNTPELKSLKKVLGKEFSYDPDKDHQVQFEKAGLYVQVAQTQK